MRWRYVEIVPHSRESLPAIRSMELGWFFSLFFPNQQLPSIFVKLPVLLLQHVFKKHRLPLCSVYDVFWFILTALHCYFAGWRRRKHLFFSCVMCQMIVSLLFFSAPSNSFQIVFIYMVSHTISIVSRCFTETRDLTRCKQQWQGRPIALWSSLAPLTGRNLEQNHAEIQGTLLLMAN